MKQLWVFLFLLGFGGASVTSTGRALVAREAYLMGTRAQLSTYAADRSSGLAIVESALEILEDADQELSTWRDDSAISALNRHPVGQIWQANARLCRMFAEVYAWQAETSGSFDPAIGSLTAVWGIHDVGRIPIAEELANARSKSGLQHLAFDAKRCTLTRNAEVTVDVGAFGKGEALDRVRSALVDVSWLIDLGGQISVHGSPPDGSAWTVAIAHPLHRREPYLEVQLREGSLSTSAGSERDLQVNGVRVAHHLDPRTGQPAAFNGSVSVAHGSALAADALSTALYVMGPEKGLEWAEKRNLAVCFLVPQNDGSVSVLTTSAFRPLLR